MTLNAHNVHRWLTHTSTVACGSLSSVVNDFLG